LLGRGLCLSILLLKFAKSMVLYQLAPLKTKSQVSKEHIHRLKLTLRIVNNDNIRVVPNLISHSILRRLLRTDNLFELYDAGILMFVHMSVVDVSKLLEEVAYCTHVRLCGWQVLDED
jgi:hypothetical protein